MIVAVADVDMDPWKCMYGQLQDQALTRKYMDCGLQVEYEMI